MKSLAATLFGCLVLPCAAQSVAPSPGAPAPAGHARVPVAAPEDPSLSRGGEPDVRHTVIEDDRTRIEELRVRGVTRQITVTPKRGGAPGYEIITGDGSRDLSFGANTSRGAAGQRVWRVLDF